MSKQLPGYLTGPCRLRLDSSGEVVTVVFDNGYRMVPTVHESGDCPAVPWLVVRMRDGAWRRFDKDRWTRPRKSQ